MQLLESLRREKKAKRLYLLICLMTVMSSADADLLGLPSSITDEMDKARNDDDFYGKAVAGFGLSLTTCTDMTKVDRYVVSQMLFVLADCVAKGVLLTKSALSSSDVLSPSTTYAAELWEAFKGKIAGTKPLLDTSDARIDEVADKLESYVNLYNRNMEIGEKDILIGKGWFNEDEDEEKYFEGK